MLESWIHSKRLDAPFSFHDIIKYRIVRIRDLVRFVREILQSDERSARGFQKYGAGQNCGAGKAQTPSNLRQ